jgi:hypothetical protein
MTDKKVLIITESGKSGSRFFEPPFDLAPDRVTVTGPESLNFLGLKRFCAIVLDSPALHRHLTKISLGIRDDAETEALWRIFCGESGAQVYILVEQKAAPSQTMRDLGIAYVLPGEIGEIVATVSSATGAESAANPAQILTADDVRDLYQSGQRRIPAGSNLTSWAAEVAESLGMSQISTGLKYLVDLSTFSPAKLKKIQSDTAALSTRIPTSLFVLNPLTLGVFAQVHPSLRERMVSSTIHWAVQGAFTGETSAAMLADLRCHGAIIPARTPYCDGKNLQLIVEQAKKHDLELFSTFTLASGTGCDIIASDGGTSNQLTPLYEARLLLGQTIPDTGAVIAGPEEYKSLPFRKG